MDSPFRISIFVVFTFLLSACSGAILTTQDPSQRVLTYGYLDMSRAGTSGFHLVVNSDQEIPSAVGGRFDYYRFPEDGFYTVKDLIPGYTYTINAIRSSAFRYNFGEQRPKSFKFKPGPADMIYVGAYRIVPYKQSLKEVLTSSGSFSLQRDTKMTEAEVLRKVRKTVGDPHWERRIDERLRQLGRR